MSLGKERRREDGLRLRPALRRISVVATVFAFASVGIGSAMSVIGVSAGPTLLFERSPGDDCLADLYSVGADGTGLRRLTFDTQFVGAKKTTSFTASFGGRPSPNGRRVVYTRQRAVGDCAHPDTRDDLFVMGKDGSGKRRLTGDGQSVGASYSPDGTSLAFGSGSAVYVGDGE
jgi:WD40 repeat protein